MTPKDYKSNPFAKAAIVQARADKAKRNAMLAAIAINSVGGLIGALLVVYSVHVVLG